MKRLLSLATLVAVLTASTYPETYVYICKGPSSTKYHYGKTCRGLSNCSTDIYKITLAEARKMGRGLCGWED